MLKLNDDTGEPRAALTQDFLCFFGRNGAVVDSGVQHQHSLGSSVRIDRHGAIRLDQKVVALPYAAERFFGQDHDG